MEAWGSIISRWWLCTFSGRHFKGPLLFSFFWRQSLAHLCLFKPVGCGRQIVLLELQVAVLQAKVKAPREEYSGDSGESLVGNFHPRKAVEEEGIDVRRPWPLLSPEAEPVLLVLTLEPSVVIRKTHCTKHLFSELLFLLFHFSCLMTVLGCVRPRATCLPGKSSTAELCLQQ